MGRLEMTFSHGRR